MNRERLAAIGIFSLQTLLIAEYSGQGQAEFALIALAIMSLFRRFEFSLAATLVGCVSMVVLGVAFQISWPPAIKLDWILPGYFVVGLGRILLLLQLFLLFKEPVLPRRRGLGNRVDTAFYVLAFHGILTCFCRAESALGATFFVAAIGAIVLFQMAFSVDVNVSSAKKNGPKGRQTFFAPFLIAFLAILAGTGFAGSLSKQVLAVLRGITTSQVANQDQEVSIVMYSSTGDLSSVTNLKETNPSHVALDIVCPVEPGYLRGKAFSTFSGTRWYDPVPSRAKQDRSLPIRDPVDFPGTTQPLVGDGNRCFELSEEAGPLRSLSIERSDGYFGNVTFSPLNTHLVSAATDRVDVNRHEIVVNRFKGIYECYVSKERRPIEVDASTLRQLLWVHRGLDPQVQQLGDQLGKDASNDLEVISQVELYFQSEFEYSLQSSSQPGADRISNFILQKEAGHCELFATAAAIVLRTQGIPTRYVTGYATMEPSRSDDNSGDMWIARNRDAHAWAEAFDRQNKRWVIVEATPGTRFPKDIWDKELNNVRGGGAGDLEEEEEETIDGVWQSFNFIYRPFSKLIDWIRSSLLVPTLVLISAGIAFLVWRWQTHQVKTDYQYLPMKKRMLQIDRILRKFELRRRASETLHQFAERLLKFEGDQFEIVHGAANEILSYAEARYRAQVG